MGFFKKREDKKREDKNNSSSTTRTSDQFYGLNQIDSLPGEQHAQREAKNFLQLQAEKSFNDSEIGKLYKEICDYRISSDLHVNVPNKAGLFSSFSWFINSLDKNGYDGMKILLLPYLYEKSKLNILTKSEKKDFQNIKENYSEKDLLAEIYFSIARQHKQGFFGDRLTEDSAIRQFTNFYNALIDLAIKNQQNSRPSGPSNPSIDFPDK